MSNIQNITNITELLQVENLLFTNNTDQIKKATEMLKAFILNDKSISAFLQILVNSNSSQSERQISGILLRQALFKHWSSEKNEIPLNTKNQIKSTLLSQILKEPSRLVRRAIVQCVSKIAVFEIPEGKWNELAPFIMNLVKSDVPVHRESGIYLCGALFESVGSSLEKNFSTFLNVLKKGLTDKDDDVRVATIKSLSTFTLLIDEEDKMKSFVEVVPVVVDEVKFRLKKGDEDVALIAFEMFNELIEIKLEAFNDCILPLLKFMLSISTSSGLNHTTRINSLNFVGWVVAYKPQVVLKNKLLAPVFTVIFKLLCEEEVDPSSDETTHKAASSLLDQVSVGIPSKYVFQPVIQNATNMLTHTNPLFRKAGITAIGILSEGCNELMRENLEKIVPLIINGFKDESKMVREVACLAIGTFSEYLQPMILDYHKQILPFIINMIKDPSYEVREKCCYSLDSFCENLPESEVGQYIKPIMTNVYELLTKGDYKSQLLAIPAISSTAASAGKAFLPYVRNVFEVLKTKVDQTKDVKLRAKATESVGIIAVAIGLDEFKSYYQTFMGLAMDGLKLASKSDDELSSELREYTYAFLANMAIILQKEIGPYLKTIVMMLMTSSKLAETTFEQNELGLKEDNVVVVRTSVVDEKVAAIRTLGILAENTKSLFAPYLKDTTDLLLDFSNHFHFEIRRAVIQSLRGMITVMTPENYDKKNTEISKGLRKIIDMVFNVYITALVQDEDKETVARACECIISLLKILGPRMLSKEQVASFVEAIDVLLNQEAACNEKVLEDEVDDHDIITIDSVSDCIDVLCVTYGPNFLPFLEDGLFESLLAYSSSERPMGDQIMVLGTFAEITRGLKGNATKLFSKMEPIATKALKIPNQDIQRNAIYCLGLICVHGKEYMKDKINFVLSYIYAVFQNKSKIKSTLFDNVCGAISRIIVGYGGQNLPLDKILPVLTSSFPLKGDIQENDALLKCFIFLSGNKLVLGCFDKIVKGYITLLGTKGMKNPTQKEFIIVLKSIQSSNQSFFNELLKSLTENEQKVLKDFF